MSDDKKQKGNWRLLLVGVVLGSVITVGYLIDKNKDREWAVWTGFGETTVSTTKKLETDKKGDIIKKTPINEQIRPRKTLWDWLGLAGTLAVPILIFIFGLLFQQREQERAEKQAELERGTAKDNLSEQAIQAYFDNIAKLLLDKELRKELFSYVELKSILDEKLRKELSTLSTHDKLNLLDKDNPVRDLARTQTITILRRLEGDEERQARITYFLWDAELYQFIFKNANLSGINLQGANLSDVNLQGATLSDANLQGANLWYTNLQGAYLSDINLQGAYLWYTNLQGAYLWRANLQGATLWGAANLQGASLSGANLQGASLSGANLTPKQIKSACFWDKAIYKGKWDWNKKTKTWVPENKQAELDNTDYIEELKKDKSSDPEQPVDCSIWKK